MSFRHAPLFSLLRQGAEEICVYGEISVSDGEKLIFSTNEQAERFPARSCLKPFQFLATGLEFQSRYAPCLGSVSATGEQVQGLREWHAGEVSERRKKHLRLSAVLPKDEALRVEVLSQGGGPDVVYNPCFAKHMAILESCEKNGWALEDYHRPNHPYETKLFANMSEWLGGRKLHTVVDGCQLPSPLLSTLELASLYQKLVNGGVGSRFQKASHLMIEFPYWIGGPGRVDTELMKGNRGIIAKEGADGLLAIGLPASSRWPKGLGIVVKLMAGYQPQLSALALVPLWDALGLNHSTTPPPGQEIKYHYRPFKKSERSVIDISPRISRELAVWPEDKKFGHHVAMSTLQGRHMTLSSIESTVHVGAHADAPNHFEPTEEGIDQVDVRRYFGPCEVVEVKKGRGTNITPADLGDFSPRAPRVIFKTSSYPRLDEFNRDFVSLSAELVDWLSRFEVCLVGIDTPSIDAFESKALSAHHATTKARMGILEGVDLTGVNPGLYTLMAVPLKLKDADASPVRAILVAD